MTAWPCRFVPQEFPPAFGFVSHFLFPLASQRHQLWIAKACRLVFYREKEAGTQSELCAGACYRAHSVLG